MACAREYDPAIVGFSSAPWKRLNLAAKFQLYQEAEFELATNVDGAQGTA